MGHFSRLNVSPNLRCVSANVRHTPVSVSANVRRKWPSIARRAVHYCAPLQISRTMHADRSKRLVRPEVEYIAAARPRSKAAGRRAISGLSAGFACILLLLDERTCFPPSLPDPGITPRASLLGDHT